MEENCLNKNGTYTCTDVKTHLGRHSSIEKVRDASNKLVAVKTHLWVNSFTPVRTRVREV